MDDKDVSESASKVENDKCGDAVAECVDLESGSVWSADQIPDWCHPHRAISICGS